MSTTFELGRIIYEARIREAWGASAEDRLERLPYPLHIGAHRAADHDLALACAKAVIADGWAKTPPPEVIDIYPGWKGITQPCAVCGKLVAVNAVSPSVRLCSPECGERMMYGDPPTPKEPTP